MQPLLLPVTIESLATATYMVLAFVTALFAGAIVLPGLERRGYPQPNGETKYYKLYGMTFFFLIHIILAIATFGFGISLAPIVQHFWSLLIVGNVIAIAWALALYFYGKRSRNVLNSDVSHNP